MLKALPFFLAGRAYEEYALAKHDGTVQFSWAQLRALMHARFAKSHVGNVVLSPQREDETVHEYAARSIAYFRRYRIDQDHVRSHIFIGYLRPQLRKFMGPDIDNFRDAEERALKLEHGLEPDMLMNAYQQQHPQVAFAEQTQRSQRNRYPHRMPRSGPSGYRRRRTNSRDARHSPRSQSRDRQSPRYRRTDDRSSSRTRRSSRDSYQSRRSTSPHPTERTKRHHHQYERTYNSRTHPDGTLSNRRRSNDPQNRRCFRFGATDHLVSECPLND